MAVYKIGEAASLLHLKTHVLRFWETEFPQIVPLRTEKGQRLYTEEHLALLARIRFLLHEHGLTIEGARKILSAEAGRGVRYTHPASSAQPHPASAGARSAAGVAASGRKRETALAGRNSSGVPRRHFLSLVSHGEKTRRPETAGGVPSASPEKPPAPDGKDARPESREGTEPARPSPEKAVSSRQETWFRQEIVAELEAVAALLQDAGEKP
jgi:DNA-binding transcriptional MerR regulator